MKRQMSMIATLVFAATVLVSFALTTQAAHAQTYQGCDPGEVCE